MIYVRDFTCGARCACAPRSVTDSAWHVTDAMLGVAACDASLAADTSKPSLGLLVADPIPCCAALGVCGYRQEMPYRGSGTADLTAPGMGPLAPPFLPATSRGFSAALEQGGGAPSSSAVYRGGDVRVCPCSGPARPAIAESAAAPLGSWRPTWPPWTWIGFMGARPPYSPEHPTGGSGSPSRPPITGSSGAQKWPKNGHF